MSINLVIFIFKPKGLGARKFAPIGAKGNLLLMVYWFQICLLLSGLLSTIYGQQILTQTGYYVRTVASGLSSGPFGVCFNPLTGDIFASLVTGTSAGKVVKINPAGSVTDFVGSLYNPFGMTINRTSGVLYVSDTDNSRILSISTTGAATIVASGFSRPVGIVYFNDLLYNSDHESPYRVRKIKVATGAVTTFGIGAGGDGFVANPSSPLSLNTPWGFTLDENTNTKYVCDLSNNRIVRLGADGSFSVFAGTGTATSTDGSRTSATFSSPKGIRYSQSIDAVYVTQNYCLRRIFGGIVTTIAGDCATANHNDGAGTVALFNGLSHIDLDADENVLLADSVNGRIKRVLICQTNSYYDSVSGRCVYTSCLPGYQIVDFSCKLCSANSFKNISGSANCTLCNIGFESVSNRTSCVQCSSGMYRSSMAHPSCLTCPLNSVCDATGFTCNVGYKVNSTLSGCEPCPVGQQSNSNRTACVSCPLGKYRPSLSLNDCIDCPQLGICTSSALIYCQSNSKINATGTGCEWCPIGTEPSSDLSSCISCVNGVSYRSSISAASCSACPLNTVCTASGFTCNAGYEPTLDGTGCQQCVLGYSKTSNGNSACAKCIAGTESAPDRLSCVSCVAGKYRPDTLVNKCIPCPQYATCTATYLTCNAGYKMNSNGDGCDQCPIGQDSVAGGNCQGCQPGLFKPSQLFATCVSCPQSGLTGCGGSSLTCQNGYFFDNNVQCKKNDTYFALQQTTTQTGAAVTSYLTFTQPLTTTTSIFATVTAPAQTQFQTQTQAVSVTVQQQVPVQTATVFVNNAAVSTVTVTSTVSDGFVTVTSGGSNVAGQQAQSANSVTIDFIGTLPISPLIFGAATFLTGFFIMLILSLICCRKSTGRKNDEEFGAVTGITTTTNTASQRTFTNTSGR